LFGAVRDGRGRRSGNRQFTDPMYGCDGKYAGPGRGNESADRVEPKAGE